ncbi:WD40-repeat-containing domain protein [Calycina marina]|uniref:WD40-repeat-containing domain protein n=1 Tax=Calycina marina TaxID=1763456 RepID=A0A9P8CB09_9HELO|nr:WD40-repeat-containing domain protein [Calycina marina]
MPPTMAFKNGEKHEWELPRFRESHQIPDGGDLWSVKFYPYTKPGIDPIFAVVGGQHILVYRMPIGKKGLEVIQSIVDLETDTDHFACAWTKDLKTNEPLLCVAGTNAKILIIEILSGKLIQTLPGHGGPINDLAISPINPKILASASDDQTVRIWTLDPDYKNQPCAAILEGDGHRDTIQSVAWHATGRYLLSGGIDRQIILWVVPKFPDENTGRDKPTRIFYPHFSTTQVHMYIVDCVAFHDDLIISKADREGSIVLWSITNFSSRNPPPPPLTAPTVRDLDNDTRSAFSTGLSPTEMYTRLLQFSIPETDVMFMRFGFFKGHGIPGSPATAMYENFGGGKGGPVLAMCNMNSRMSFWDFSRLEEHAKYMDTVKDNPDTKRPAFLVPFKSRNRGGKSSNPMGRLASESRVSPSASSERSSTFAESVEKGAKAAADVEKSKDIWAKKYAMGNAQVNLLPHKEEMVKGLSFLGRQVAWSVGGEWCVVVGSLGVIGIFERWSEK